MKKYKKIYLEYFNFFVNDFIYCEMCNSEAVDIHHIIPRGMGGSKTKDYIENLIALCRSCHIKAESSKEFNKKCKTEHLKNMITQCTDKY